MKIHLDIDNISIIKSLSTIIVLLLSSSLLMSQEYPTSREVWKWPLSRYSIWNMPIGVKAVYVPAKMPVPDTYAGDCNYIHVNKSVTPPVVQFKKHKRSNEDFIPSLAVDTGHFVNNKDSENKVLTVFSNDSTRYWSIQPAVRESSTGNFKGYLYLGGPGGGMEQPIEMYHGMIKKEQRTSAQSIYGLGLGGGHWGSALAGFQGGIRKSELLNDTPIRHALAVEVSGWVVLYMDTTDTKWDIEKDDYLAYGFRWPADRNDGGAAGKGYYGNVHDLRMGALLALKPDVNIDSLKLITKAAKKLAWTFQNYGGYIVDDAAGRNSKSNIFNFAYEQGVNEEFKSEYGYDFDIHWKRDGDRNQPFFKDLDKIIPLLSIVSNNRPKSIGGGGNPRQSYAPPFSNGVKDPVVNNPNGNVTMPAACPIIK